MKLLYLSQVNLKDRLFVKDFAHSFKPNEKAIIVHEPWATVGETLTVSKRLSSMLSETMVYNTAFSAATRNMITQQEDGLQISVPAIEQHLTHIQALILAPVILVDGQQQVGDIQAMTQALRYQLRIEQVYLFPANPLSPLGNKKPMVEDQTTQQQLLSVYEEEQATIELAYQLRPATIASPTNFSS